MNQILIYVLSFISISVVIYMLIKKMDIKITLFAVGIVLMYIAVLCKIPVIEESVNGFVDPIISVINTFKKTLSGAGLVILMLGGYAAYMNKIGANDVTVNTLTKPMKGIKSVYILVPLMFLLGNVLSLVVPSASNLAIILLSTLYPILKKSGMSTLTAAAVIATTATVMPTPLGADNVAISAELGMTASNYVFNYHAIVSIPTLIVMALAHMIWQKYCDKKGDNVVDEELEIENVTQQNHSTIYKFIYTILPLLPILILFAVFAANTFMNKNINLSVETVTFISFIIAIFCELFTNKFHAKETLEKAEAYFVGMGNSVGILVLLVSASTFVNGLKAIGIINLLETSMANTHTSGILLPLILVILSVIIVLISGSGTALFYAMVPLMVPLATAAGITPYLITVPMGLAGNLMRAVSPVSAVIMIVSGKTKKQPIEIVKRTSIPMIIGVIFMFLLSLIIFK